MLYRGPFSTAFYRTLHLALHREFRLRRAWAQLKRGRSTVRSTVGAVMRAMTLPFVWLRLRWLRTRLGTS